MYYVTWGFDYFFVSTTEFVRFGGYGDFIKNSNRMLCTVIKYLQWWLKSQAMLRFTEGLLDYQVNNARKKYP